MLVKLARKGIEDFPIEVARGAIMLEDFYDTEGLFGWGISFEYLLFEVLRRDLFHSGGLLYLFGLIEVMKLPSEVLFNQFAKIFADLVKVD